ncbi:MAG: tetratricopeptide repeat protein [Anaerolineae bacterium]|nr:tetratricopeptide repeat protein [Anaerolineae bacterium]
MFELDFESYINQPVSDDPMNSPSWPAVHPETDSGSDDEPSKAEILLQLGILYWRRGDFDRAEQVLTKASEVSEEDHNIRFLAQCFIGLALVKTSLEKTDDAIAAYEQAVTLVPENFHLWKNMGRLYLKHNKFEQALDTFKKALTINPDDSVAWTGLANTHDQNGSVDEAINAYKRAIDLMPNTNLQHPNIDLRTPVTDKHIVFPWIRLAVLYTKKSQYQKAINAYQKILFFDAENAEAWNEIGTLYIETETYQESIKALSKAIELNPKYGQAHLRLAFAFTKLGQHQDSISHYLKSIDWLKNRQEKELALDLMEDAICTMREQGTKKTNKKVDALKMGSSSHNEATWFYYKYSEEITSVNLSRFVYDLEKRTKRTSAKLANRYHLPNAQQPKKGERDMPRILPLPSVRDTQAKPDTVSDQPKKTEAEIADPNVWIEKGNIHFNNQAYRDAINAYNRAIEIDSTFGQPYNNLGLIHLMQGNYNKAILLYQKGVKLLTTDREKAIAWNGLGNVYRCIKDYENARIAYMRASELDETNGDVYDRFSPFEVSGKYKTPDFWIDLGKLFFKAGVYDKAASAFQEAIRLEPSSGLAYGHLARTLTAQGQYKKAVPLYHKSINLIPGNNEKAKVWNRLGDLYRKLNNYDNARKAYQNATTLTNDKASLLSRTRHSLLSNCEAK